LDKHKIVLVGRTNVGKSGLFNKLARKHVSLVSKAEYTTRDVVTAQLKNNGAIMYDTPGMLASEAEIGNQELFQVMNRKLDEIINAATLILFVIDSHHGITSKDLEISRILRKKGKEVIVVANKSEGVTDAAYTEAIALGYELVATVSAKYGLGLEELIEMTGVYNEINQDAPLEEATEQEPIKIAIVGRPNVGKSTMVNTILGRDVRLVADFMGLTRESYELDFTFNGKQLKIVDTPGLRRRSRMVDTLEKISSSDAQNSYRHADAVILVADASTLDSGKIEKQTINLAAAIADEGKALVIAFNKYDKTPYQKDDYPEFLRRNFATSFAQLKNVPFLFVSAKNNENIDKMLDMIVSCCESQKVKIKTSTLNAWLKEINKEPLMQSVSSRFKLKYITQIGISPPLFIIFAKNRKSIRKEHERYVVKKLKECFDLTKVMIKVIFRDSEKKVCKKDV
jgi:GTP-binding protein